MIGHFLASDFWFMIYGLL